MRVRSLSHLSDITAILAKKFLLSWRLFGSPACLLWEIDDKYGIINFNSKEDLITCSLLRCKLS